MVAPALFSSAHTEWATPRDLAAALVAEYGITTDVCADVGNAVVPRFFAKEDDGLAQRWEGVCWMNPPFGSDIGRWVAKAAQHASDGDALVVCLLPVRSDTRWWHASVWDAHRHRPRCGVEIRFLKGRLRFGGAKNTAPFPVAVVVFHPPRSLSSDSPIVICARAETS